MAAEGQLWHKSQITAISAVSAGLFSDIKVLSAFKSHVIAGLISLWPKLSLFIT